MLTISFLIAALFDLALVSSSADLLHDSCALACLCNALLLVTAICRVVCIFVCHPTIPTELMFGSRKALLKQTSYNSVRGELNPSAFVYGSRPADLQPSNGDKVQVCG